MSLAKYAVIKESVLREKECVMEEVVRFRI